VRDPKLRSQGAPMVIAPEELKMLAVMKMQRSGLDIKGYAEKLGIHPQKHIKLYSHDDKAI
jgi:hypothetical protein